MTHLKNFFQEIANSITKFDSYRVWQDESFGKNFWYLFKLLILTTLLSILPFFFYLLSQSPKLPNLISQGKQAVREAFPKELVLTFKNGQLETNVKEPYYYDLPKSLFGDVPMDKHLITIDTSSQVEDYDKFNTAVLVTKNAVIYPKSNSSQKEVMFFNEVKDGKIGYQDYMQGITQLDPLWNYIYPGFWVLVVALILIMPFLGAAFGILGQLVYFVFIGLAVFLVTKLFGMNKKYGQVYKIMMRASTLPILFFTALGIFNLNTPIPFAYSLVLGGFSLAVLFHIKKDFAPRS